MTFSLRNRKMKSLLGRQSHTVSPQFSPGGLIVNFETSHGLIRGEGLFEERGLFKSFIFDMGAYSNRHIVLHAELILEKALCSYYNK